MNEDRIWRTGIQLSLGEWIVDAASSRLAGSADVVGRLSRVRIEIERVGNVRAV